MEVVTTACLRATALTRESRERPGRATAPRAITPGLSEEVHVDSLVLLPRRTALQGTGRVVPLTTAEWSLLTTLIEGRGEVLDRSRIAARAWGPGFADRRNEVEVYVSRLRRKLRMAGAAARIETIRGRGYRLSSAPTPPDRTDGAPSGGSIPGVRPPW